MFETFMFVRYSRGTSNYLERITLSDPTHMKSMTDLVAIDVEILRIDSGRLTKRNREVVDFKRYCVKNYSKLTNFRKFTRIEGYNGKYGSNPQGIKEFLDVFFKFDQIGRGSDGRNWGKWYFMKLDFKSIPRNQKSSNLDLISRRNQDSKWREIFERKNRDFR